MLPLLRRGFRLMALGWFLAAAHAQEDGLEAVQEATLGPAAALAFDSGQPDTARALEAVIKEGDPWEQLDWTFTLRPSVLYRTYLDERGGEMFSPRLSTTLQIRFGERPLDTVRRAARLERALRAHDRARRLESRNALLAFAELLLAQDAYMAAARALRDLAGDATAAQRQAAELAFRTEDADLQAARRDAADYGMRGVAQYESLRFSVPAAPLVTELSAYRLQQLALAEAETRFLEAGGAGMVRDFRLGLGYRTEGFEVDLETGYMAGRPGLRLGTIHPGGRARMEVRVSAEIAIGDSIFELPRLQENVELAQAELDRLADELWAGWLVASLDASLAEENLDVEEAFLAEARVALQEALDALALLSDDADDRELTRHQTAVERAEREVQRLTTRMYRAWITYVRRHHDMLEAAEAEWAVR